MRSFIFIKGIIVKLASIVSSVALIGALTVSPMAMAADKPITDTQKKQIEKIVHDYLVNNPEVLIEASQALQRKQQDNMRQQAKTAIENNASQLFSGKLTTLGNPKGNVTLVEFFDYQCVHCKKMAPVVDSLIEKDKNLRVIYKEFPIFGKTSETASRAALAAAMQGKYKAFHEALISKQKRLSDKDIFSVAKKVGLNLKKLKQDMKSKQVTATLAENKKLAEKMMLMGTPAFIIAKTPKGIYLKGSEPAFIPGAASEDTLRDLIMRMSK